jgi:tetratricopeptide (TPR) repeat protein
MATNRLEVLKGMLSANPQDSFARYGLAMEYAKTGQLEQAVAEFHTLLEHDEKYAAGYFHGGQAMEKLGRLEDARKMYEKGIEVTGRTGDSHTRSELQAALDMLPI